LPSVFKLSANSVNQFGQILLYLIIKTIL